eukprot:COSAG05_NODE_13_length_36464_cov_294.169449_31_plen_102_part_00
MASIPAPGRFFDLKRLSFGGASKDGRSEEAFCNAATEDPIAPDFGRCLRGLAHNILGEAGGEGAARRAARLDMGDGPVSAPASGHPAAVAPQNCPIGLENA